MLQQIKSPAPGNDFAGNVSRLCLFLRKWSVLHPIFLLFFCMLTGFVAGPDLDVRLAPTVPSGDTILNISICQGEKYTYNGQMLTLPGAYEFTLTGADGSDSIVTLQLEVLLVPRTELDTSICQGETVEFNGKVLQTTGLYRDTFTAANGCDSIASLKLTVRPVPVTQWRAGICEGTFYIFQGDTLRDSGVYRDTFPAANGCDSLVVLKLEVVPFFDIKIQANICPGDTYIFGEDTLSAEGVYVDSLQAIGGCDSTVTLSLNLLPLTDSTLNISICSGENYIFNGDTLDVAGAYTAVLTGKNGCDSTVTLQLALRPLLSSKLNAAICTGENYNFNGRILSEAGVYTDTLTGSNGCDSTVTLALSVLPLLSWAEETAICAGDTLDFNGQLLTAAGTYTAVLEASNGCDSTVTLTLTVLPQAASSLQASICQGEKYNFNGLLLGQSGTYTVVLAAANGCDSTVSLLLTVYPGPVTNLDVAVCDGEVYEYNGEIFYLPGTYPFVFQSINGCDSTVNLRLKVLPVAAGSVKASICQGEIYSFFGVPIDRTGNYSTVLPGGATNGCDSLIMLVLTVLPVKQTALNATVCEDYRYVFGGDTLTASGVYRDTLPGSNGCDSIVTLNLTLVPFFASNIAAAICEGETYPFAGQLRTTSGVYADTLVAQTGCDSITTLTLTVLPKQKTNLAASICAGEVYTFNGEPLNESAVYSVTLNGSNGCDSVVMLTLTVLPLSSSSQSVRICANESYLFGGDTLTASGVYRDTLANSNGCDSTATLTLEVLALAQGAVEAAVCAGQTYDFHGETLSQSGTYTTLLTAANGCDSTLTLRLTVLPEIKTAQVAQICTGLSYDFNGIPLTKSGMYRDTLPAANGCDSILVLELTVAPALTTTLETAICQGESYLFDGDALTESGNYTATFSAAGGCDSVVALALTVLPTLSSNIEAAFCPGTPYEFNGQILTEAGAFTATLSGSNGCDSTVTLVLSLLPVLEVELNQTICAGDSLAFNGQQLKLPGTYKGVFEAVNGCDSLVTLHLSVLPVAKFNLTATACADKPFPFNNQLIDKSGVYSYTLPHAAANGCDSVLTLDLTLIPVVEPTVMEATICAGTSYTFLDEDLTQSGSYSRILPSQYGCDSLIVLNLTVLPSPVDSIARTICQGDTYEFYDQSLTQAGVYSALLKTISGCDSILILTLSVTPSNYGVAIQGATLVAVAPGASFQWLDCDNNLEPIAGATGNTFTATVTGQYAVQVTQNACTFTSQCYPVVVVSTEAAADGLSWSVQPNPAQTAVTLELHEAFATPLRLALFDLNGRLLREAALPAGAETLTLNLSGLPDGMLVLRLTDGARVWARRLVKLENE